MITFDDKLADSRSGQQWNILIAGVRRFAVEQYGPDWTYVGDGQQLLTIKRFSHTQADRTKGIPSIISQFNDWVRTTIKNEFDLLNSNDIVVLNSALLEQHFEDWNLISDKSFLQGIVLAGFYAISSERAAILAKIYGLQVIGGR